jgi:hypothetical protein
VFFFFFFLFFLFNLSNDNNGFNTTYLEGMYSLAPYCFIGTLMVLCPLQNPYSATGLAGVGKGRTIFAERV